jgi:hypothetical protein
MWIRTLIMFSGALLSLNANPSLAEPLQERVALMLSGKDCPSLQPSIAEALQQAPGVTRVDLSILPDHVMIDRVQSRFTPDDFAAIVNKLTPVGASCRAEIMKSCITADLASAPRLDPQ